MIHVTIEEIVEYLQYSANQSDYSTGRIKYNKCLREAIKQIEEAIKYKDCP